MHQDHAMWVKVGETEVIDNNLNPEWITHFNVKYNFTKDTELWFQVWHVESEEEKRLIGQTIFPLSTLMRSKNQTIEKDLIPELPDEEKVGKHATPYTDDGGTAKASKFAGKLKV